MVHETRRTTGLFWSVLVFFCVVALVFFGRWLPHLAHALIGPPEDNLQDFWNTWYAAAGKGADFFHTRLIRFPGGTDLHYESFAYPQVFAVALLSKVAGAGLSRLVLFQNLTLLASFPLAGLGAFYLVRHFTRDVIGAAAGGFTFAFSPWHVQQVMHHAHVSTIEFLPLFVVAYLLAIERRSVAWLIAATLFCALSALSCWYFLFYAAYFMAFHFAYTAVRARSADRWSVGVPLACFLATLAILSPLLIPMIAEAARGAAVYTQASDTNTYVADVAAWLAFPPAHLLHNVTGFVYARATGFPWETTVYLGIVNIAALVWCWFQRPHSSHLPYVLAGMATFLVIASGDSLHVLGRALLPMPDALLSSLPFFANVRTPARAAVFVYLFLAIGVGLAASTAWSQSRTLILKVACIGVAMLAVLDLFPFGLALTPASCAPGWTQIRADPSRDFGVLMLPLGVSARGPGPLGGRYYNQDEYMFQQAACHGRPIVQGISSRVAHASLIDELDVRDFHKQHRQLMNARVKYIVYDRSFVWDPRDGPGALYRHEYPAVYDRDDMTIFRVY